MSIARVFAALCLSAPLLAGAGTFSVSPIRMDLSSSAKAGSVTVSNEGAPLALKVSLMRWTQDLQGNDHYEPSTDLVYFPRESRVPSGGSRVVRAALNTEPGEIEKAYRLYIEEEQTPDTVAQPGSRIAVLVRFGVPVYIAARNPLTAVAFDALPAQGSTKHVRLRNAGNSHVYVNALTAPGVAFGGFQPRYLLAGAATAIALEQLQCDAGAPVVAVDTAQGKLTAQLPSELCAE